MEDDWRALGLHQSKFYEELEESMKVKDSAREDQFWQQAARTVIMIRKQSKNNERKIVQLRELRRRSIQF